MRDNKEMKEQIKVDLELHYSDPDINQLLAVASFFDLKGFKAPVMESRTSQSYKEGIKRNTFLSLVTTSIFSLWLRGFVYSCMGSSKTMLFLPAFGECGNALAQMYHYLTAKFRLWPSSSISSSSKAHIPT